MCLLILNHEYFNNIAAFFSQFVRSDDPLENITTAEAIRKLIQHYNRSQNYYNARQKVDDISRIVSTNTGFVWDLNSLQKTLLINNLSNYFFS